MVGVWPLGPRRPRRAERQRLGGPVAPAAAALLLLAFGRLAAPTPAPAWVSAGARCRRIARRASASSESEPEGLRAKASLDLLKAQTKSGFALKDLGQRLEAANFEASALDGRLKVAYDGTQQLRRVEVAADALESAGGDSDTLAKELLGALQKAFDSSQEGSREDVWQTYRSNRTLMDAPLNQLGAGGTEQDPWANVTSNEETVRLAEELFAKFDEDNDGYWSLNETSKVQMATEGTEMQEEAFNALIIAAAPDGGRKLTEEELTRGLSREQVIELYTDAQRQRQLGFVLDIYKDYAKVFQGSDSEEAKAAVGEAPAAEGGPAPAVD